MSKNYWMLLLLTIYSIIAPGAIAQETAAMSAKPDVIVNFQPVLAGGKLKVQYTIANKTASPIVVFDRMRNLRTGEPDPNWAFVDIIGRAAILKRAQEPTEVPLVMENIPVPYAREIAPGGTVTGSFNLRAQLTQSDPYHQMSSKTPLVIESTTVEMWIGWCFKSELTAASRHAVKFGEDSVWIPSYMDVGPIQKIAKSAPIAMTLRVRTRTKR